MSITFPNTWRVILKKKQRLALHLLFWAIVVGFYTLFFGHQRQNYWETLAFACLMLPITSATSYFLMYVLLPRFLFAREYLKFALFFIYTLVVSLWLELLSVVLALIFLADYQASRLNPATLDITFLLAGTYMVVFAALSIKLFKRWSEIQQAKLLTELRLREAELNLLKAQIQPHFLFNTLNTLYGFALEKSEKTPDLILKLSALLDYTLYHSNQNWVSLEKELQYLRNFIALEQVRYGNRLKISIDIKGKLEGYYLAPMLLQPFVENSFKHGRYQDITEPFMSLELEVSHQKLNFRLSNAYVPSSLSANPTAGGLGLNNIRRRLDWLYPEAYRLEIAPKEAVFLVNLELPLKTSPAEKVHLQNANLTKQNNSL